MLTLTRPTARRMLNKVPEVRVYLWVIKILCTTVGESFADYISDAHGVPLWISSAGFAGLLAAVFALWCARERSLSIHAINTTPREGWYWLVVLVTFALGTAAGDWTLELPVGEPGRRSSCRPASSPPSSWPGGSEPDRC